jgi:3-oxoacyl-(acyl-carrier-protein) synthase
MVLPNMAAGQVSIHLGSHGPTSCVATACAAANDAIGDVFKIIQRGDADVMLGGGTEAMITPLAAAAFGNMKALDAKGRSEARQSAL